MAWRTDVPVVGQRRTIMVMRPKESRACWRCGRVVGKGSKYRRYDVEVSEMRGDDVVVHLCLSCDSKLTDEVIVDLACPPAPRSDDVRDK